MILDCAASLQTDVVGWCWTTAARNIAFSGVTTERVGSRFPSNASATLPAYWNFWNRSWIVFPCGPFLTLSSIWILLLVAIRLLFNQWYSKTINMCPYMEYIAYGIFFTYKLLAVTFQYQNLRWLNILAVWAFFIRNSSCCLQCHLSALFELNFEVSALAFLIVLINIPLVSCFDLHHFLVFNF